MERVKVVANIVGFFKGAFEKAKRAGGKVKSFIAPSQTRSPETWVPGAPPPRGYRVVFAGSRSEKIEPIPLTERGGLRAALDRELLGPGADTLRKVGGDFLENVRNVATRVGDAAAAGLAKSEKLKAEKRKLFIGFGVLAAVSLVTLLIVLSRKRGTA